MKSFLLHRFPLFITLILLLAGISLWLRAVLPGVRDEYMYRKHMKSAADAMADGQFAAAAQSYRSALTYRETPEILRNLKDASERADCAIAFRRLELVSCTGAGKSKTPGRYIDLRKELARAAAGEVESWKRQLEDSEKHIRALEQDIEDLEELLDIKEDRRSRTMKGKRLRDLYPDGEVLAVDSDLGLVWIDCDRGNGVIKGMKFKVFRYIKGGRPKEKGTIVVRNISRKRTICAILETFDEKDPLVKGDYYISPLFDRNEQKIFVFAGQTINTRYSWEELGKKVECTGAKVDKMITVDTDFLVCGKDAEAEESFQRAIRLGVIIIREKELLEYIGD